MQISPIRNTNFGLTLSDEAKNLLRKSASKMKGDDSREWIATERAMKNSLSDDYTLVLEDN